jgi:hypothetical protein
VRHTALLRLCEGISLKSEKVPIRITSYILDCTLTHLFGIDYNNMIPHILVCSEGRFVLSPEDLGNLPGQATNGLIFSVYEMPCSL